MIIAEMTEEECREVLERVSFGRLGCARDNQPYVVPIFFACHGGHLYGFSTPGQKIDWMRANPLVCVEVDERTSFDRWASVIVLGRFQELADAPEFAADRAQAQRALQQRAMWWEYASIPGAEWRRKQAPFVPIFYRLLIETMTGHRATPAVSP